MVEGIYMFVSPSTYTLSCPDAIKTHVPEKNFKDNFCLSLRRIYTSTT